ncbi:MAG: hypothetical protein HOP28_17950 [Gemmatimonadales bacterium]|nr:hypothetical protein [Gemmatimonadales bacterium]
MTPRLAESLAAFLVPDDERGRAVLGDLAEMHAVQVKNVGAGGAARWYWSEVLRSTPAFLRSGLAERGLTGLLLRSIPAVLGGFLTLFVMVTLGEWLLGLVGLGGQRFFSLAVAAAYGVGGGWVAAVLGGQGPRQHALALGISCATFGTVSYFFAPVPPPMWYWFGLQAVVIPSTLLGGYVRWRAVRRPGSRP